MSIENHHGEFCINSDEFCSKMMGFAVRPSDEGGGGQPSDTHEHLEEDPSKTTEIRPESGEIDQILWFVNTRRRLIDQRADSEIAPEGLT